MLVVAALAAVMTLVGFGVATSAGAAASPSTSPYPPTCFLIKLSTTTPNPGQTITVSGQDFTPDIDVSVVLDTHTVLATTHTTANGTFAVDVTLPAGVTGTHTISATGDPRLASGDCPAASVTISIGAESSTSSGGLASTGVDILTGVAVALALIGAGVLITRSARRRGHNPSH
jgi:hypothetical protein